jgi:MFS family permease
VVVTCISLVGGIFTSRWSGRLVDLHGPKRVLRWGHLGWATLPLFWLLAPRDSLTGALLFIACSNVISGVACNAAVTAANKLVIRYPRPEKVAMYSAVSSCLGSLAGGLGAMAAGGALALLSGWKTSVGGYAIGAFQVVFIVSMVLRFGTTALLTGRIVDPAPDPADREGPAEPAAPVAPEEID